MWFSLDLQVQFQFDSTQNIHLKSNSTHDSWSNIRERVRNFGESGAQQVDVPPIF